MIDLMMMAYAGLRNKRIVEMCQKAGLNAVGLSGLDGRMVQENGTPASACAKAGKCSCCATSRESPNR